MKPLISVTFILAFCLMIISSKASNSVVIYSTNFGKIVNVNPTGWIFTGSNLNISNNGGSRFYHGASCGAFLAEGNSLPFQNTSGFLMKGSQPGISTATLLISTIGFNSINISFGMKKSSNGYNSAVNYKLEWSNDGNTYYTINFTEPQAGMWGLISERGMLLPAAASNQPTLYLKWTFNRTRSTANFKIDDFKVCGTNMSCFPVSILSQPTNTSINCSGADTVSFKVNVGGTGPFTYQWQENKINILDNAVFLGTNSSTLTIRNPAIISNGKNYRCIISNCSGSTVVTSDSAVLSFVNSPITIQPNSTTNICRGDSTVLSTVFNQGNTYQWFQLISEQPRQELIISNASTTSLSVLYPGDYFLKSLDLNGCLSISNTISINVNDLPESNITINGPLTFCIGGDSVQLSVNNLPANSYLWSNGETVAAITVLDSGYYQVKIKNQHGCDAISSQIRINTYRLIADIDSDGYIGQNDYLLLLQKFDTPCASCKEDINNDGLVDIFDFLDFLEQYGLYCP